MTQDDLKQPIDRALSSHVGSRWYRAPEIILVEKRYDQQADIWSVGTILYELMQIKRIDP